MLKIINLHTDFKFLITYIASQFSAQLPYRLIFKVRSHYFVMLLTQAAEIGDRFSSSSPQSAAPSRLQAGFFLK